MQWAYFFMPLYVSQNKHLQIFIVGCPKFNAYMLAKNCAKHRVDEGVDFVGKTKNKEEK